MSLKRRYPARVHLLIGNRDANKLRFATELSRAALDRPLRETRAPFWLPPSATARAFLRELARDGDTRASSDACSSNGHGGDGEDARIAALNTRANRLRFILERTMGCPHTFEHRRRELCALLLARVGAQRGHDGLEALTIGGEEHLL